MIQKIVKSTHHKLRKKSLEVENASSIKKLIQDLVDTRKSYEALGLAAIQIGVRKRVALICPPEKEAYIIINPVITSYSDEIEMGVEGCLSYKGKQRRLHRHKSINIEYIDINGNKCRGVAEELEARILQHEVDHMDGILMEDR